MMMKRKLPTTPWLEARRRVGFAAQAGGTVVSSIEQDLRSREQAEEARWRLKQEKAFEVAAKRDKLFGLWAAARLGLGGDSALAYARRMVDTGVGRGDAAMIGMVADDLAAAGIAPETDTLPLRLRQCEDQAITLVAQTSAA